MKQFSSLIITLPLTYISTVTANCNRFTTNDTWAVKLNGYDGYSFLLPEPIQISDFVTCTSSLAANSTNSCSTSNSCTLLGKGGISTSARYNVTPTNNNVDVLETFFMLVSDAAAKNKGDSDVTPPSFNICGNVTHQYEKAGVDTPEFCIAQGDSGWIRYDPQYLCVNGTADECTDGPFENGTSMVVCGLAEVAKGTMTVLENRTVGSGDARYRAADNNPSLGNQQSCEASLGAENGRVRKWSLGVVAISVVVGLLV
ncbi:hypothetical protein ABW20_dc0100456 [Dactylellina cionopaga]|nr:hypothetical protein ABW20_dc0100456 [Dactylellina cionopaga]